MKLYRVVLPVPNIRKAVEFYEQLLGMKCRLVSPGRHYFNCEGTILACFDPRADGDDWDAQPNPDHIYFEVDDLEQVFQSAKSAGAIFPNERIHEDPADEIATRPWGERSFYVVDPFGNKLCFVDRKTAFTGS